MKTGTDSVNAMIGDLSALRAGILPSHSTEQIRIQHHLQYVHDFLQTGATPQLTAQRQRKRQQVLTVLQDYIDLGVFPRHTDPAITQRQPRFIDDRGVHCAVGFLAYHTGDSRWGEQINARFEYALLPDLDSPELLDWAQDNGLSARDCALIQPQYMPQLPDCPIMFLAQDTPLQTRLDIVRAFRDEHLARLPGGRWAVRYYYQNGSRMVRFLDAHQWSQLPARRFLELLIDTLEQRRSGAH